MFLKAQVRCQTRVKNQPKDLLEFVYHPSPGGLSRLDFLRRHKLQQLLKWLELVRLDFHKLYRNHPLIHLACTACPYHLLSVAKL